MDVKWVGYFLNVLWMLSMATWVWTSPLIKMLFYWQIVV